MQALPHDMIGIALTNASPLVAPTFSTDRLLGTNPIAVAIPAGEQPPLVVDMATTTVATVSWKSCNEKSNPPPPGGYRTRPVTPPPILRKYRGAGPCSRWEVILRTVATRATA